MIDYMINSQKDLERAVSEVGILPLFKNSIEGFSVEEHSPAELWFEGVPGPWEWKGPVIRNLQCAYGKFLGNKAVFISKEWFPDFANWRRDGYDFDARFEDELASYKDKVLFDLLEANTPILSGDLKKKGNYSAKGNTGFDTIMTRLQAQCYIIVSDFVYKKDKHGLPYGWGVAQYSTPEAFMGRAFSENVYRRKPEESYERIVQHLMGLGPEFDRKSVERLLNKSFGSEKSAAVREWLVPSNPKYYDVIAAFEAEDVILWKQGNDNIRIGDTVFLYVGVPYSAILYRCEVVETDIPFHGKEEHVNIKNMMRIRKLEQYPKDKWRLEEMKKYGVVTVRCTRSMPAKLLSGIMSER